MALEYEPEVKAIAGVITEAEVPAAIVSIAISLKRIADAIEGSPSKEGLAVHLGNVLSDSIFNLKR